MNDTYFSLQRIKKARPLSRGFPSSSPSAFFLQSLPASRTC